ncbi:hypothetical protein SNE40_017873 [Patella caerulea]|uniref:CIDE-N domain-containing protein n=1 Tax=Patella caerulea TaxID=87958 RepID=A0AAN8JHV9_PATCE
MLRIRSSALRRNKVHKVFNLFVMYPSGAAKLNLDSSYAELSVLLEEDRTIIEDNELMELADRTLFLTTGDQQWGPASL